MASSTLLVDFLPQNVPLSPLNIGLIAAGLLLIYAFISANRNTNHAPALKDPIPYVYNAYQYMTDQPAFLNRVRYIRSNQNKGSKILTCVCPRNALKNQPIVSFHVGPLKFYMVKSPKSIQALFRTSPSVSSNKFMHMIFENMMNFAPHDTARFDHDLSGRLPTPLPTANKPSKRYWAPYHAILHNYLARAHETNKLGLTYQQFFGERLEKYPVGEWVEGVKIREFLYRDMFIAATTAFCGPRMLALNPNLIDVFWKHHEIAVSLVYGLPRFLNKRALNIREQFHSAARKYLEGAELEPKEKKEEGDWDEVWGSSVNRELCRFFAREGFEMRSQAGALCVTNVFG